ncbi:MAG: hypothetical protein J6Y54_09015 [Lentisphaeria bacterium]|nr:hypothetical protein [Lentisphaeria bacterium]
MSLNNERNTPYRKGELRTFAAGGTIYAGGLAALDSNGKAVAATPTSGAIVVGVAQNTASSGGKVDVKRGVFPFEVASGATITLADVKKPVYVVDDQTVTPVSSGAAIEAGKVFDVDGEGVWVEVK